MVLQWSIYKTDTKAYFKNILVKSSNSVLYVHGKRNMPIDREKYLFRYFHCAKECCMQYNHYCICHVFSDKYYSFPIPRVWCDINK